MNLQFVLMMRVPASHMIILTSWISVSTPVPWTLAQTTEIIRPRLVSTIGAADNSWLLNAQGMTRLDDGTLLVSDKLAYTVKRFNRNGRMIGEYGKRGKEAGEFRAPGPLDAFHDTVAVADYASPRIQLFSTQFTHFMTFYAPGPVFDLAFDHNGALWVGAATGRAGKSLFQYDGYGRLKQSVALKYSRGDEFDDIFSLVITPSNDIVVSYIVLNKIEIWNVEGQFKSECEVPGVIRRPPRRNIARGIFAKPFEVPEGNISWGIAVDPGGNLYVLSAEYSEHQNRDVVVFDPAGKYRTRFCLPFPASNIWIDPQGYLYTAENHRTILRQYRLE